MKTAEELGNLSQGELVAMVLELQKEVEKQKESSDTWYKSYKTIKNKYELLTGFIKNVSELHELLQ